MQSINTTQFTSKYAGTCNVCGTNFQPGTRICQWEGQLRGGQYAHAVCPPVVHVNKCHCGATYTTTDSWMDRGPECSGCWAKYMRHLYSDGSMQYNEHNQDEPMSVAEMLAYAMQDVADKNPGFVVTEAN